MQANYAQCSSSVAKRKEKVNATLARLKSLKRQVSELRAQCEALKKLELEKKEGLKCRECGKVVNPHEVTLKDSFGKVKGYYHKDCFTEIWRSENWRFDYSYPGFLRTSSNNC